MEYDGRKLHTYTNEDDNNNQDTDNNNDLRHKHNVKDYEKRYELQNLKYTPCMLRYLSVETASVEFLKYDSLKKFLREKTYFHFVFHNPLTNEFLHQLTLNTGEFLKTELVCFKEMDLDLYDLKNPALNATPFLSVTM